MSRLGAGMGGQGVSWRQAVDSAATGAGRNRFKFGILGVDFAFAEGIGGFQASRQLFWKM
jgi:hypothetical protein